MKKVYVIGSGHINIERIREVTATPTDVEIISVKSLEDIPPEERSEISIIQRDYEFRAPPILPSVTYFDDRKRKSHKRPYKFHK